MRKCPTCGQCRGHVECLRKVDGNECADCSIPQPCGKKKTHLHTVTLTKVPILLLKKLNSSDISLINSS